MQFLGELRPLTDTVRVTRTEPGGVRWADDSFEPVEAIVWATGFRPVGHLAPLGLTSAHGGIRLRTTPRDVRSATADSLDPRVLLVGYGPSASTIGGNRAGRAAPEAARRWYADEQSPAE